MALDARTKALKAAGQPIISFGVGEPDFPTPEPIKHAASRAMADDRRTTPRSAASPPCGRRSRSTRPRSPASRSRPSQVIATTGAKEALYLALQAVCDVGDEVLMPAPYWVTYAEQARLAGATVVPIDTAPATLEAHARAAAAAT